MELAIFAGQTGYDRQLDLLGGLEHDLCSFFHMFPFSSWFFLPEQLTSQLTTLRYSNMAMENPL